jgi:hypothetical protein
MTGLRALVIRQKFHRSNSTDVDVVNPYNFAACPCWTNDNNDNSIVASKDNKEDFDIKIITQRRGGNGQNQQGIPILRCARFFSCKSWRVKSSLVFIEAIVEIDPLPF